MNVPNEAGFEKYIHYLREIFATADYHIQTEPVCCHRLADLTTMPVSRQRRTPAAQIRQQLGVPAEAQVVLITMGGIPEHYQFLPQLASQPDIYFVVPGIGETMQVHGNTMLLPHHSAFFHPDLVHACDAVVGKVGYSTLAEVYYAGVPFGYIARERFRESQVCTAYIAAHMSGLALAETAFADGTWLARLPELLALPRQRRQYLHNGAEQIAHFVYGLLRHDVAAPTTTPLKC